MEIRTSTVAVIAASCITVGAAGAFLASRPSTSEAPPAAPAADVASGGVDQSEGVITETPTVPAPAAATARSAALAPAVAPPAKPRVESPRAAPAPAPPKSAPARVQNTPPATEQPRPAIAESRPIATPPTTTQDNRVIQ